MPIPNKIKSRDLAGRRLALSGRIRTGACSVDIPAGTRMTVADVAGGFALSSPEPCPCCGISVRLDRVPRSRVFLDDDPDAPHPENVAFWNSRREQNDHTWCQCSNCGFIIENYKAVKQGISSDDYVGVKWKFCPECGKRMAIRNAYGKAVL